MRRMDEAGRLAEVLPPSIVLQVDIAALAQRLADLPDEVNGILRLVDGRKSLREIVAVSPLDDLSTLAVVQRLLGDHVLRRAGKAAVARAKPSLSEWLRPEGAVGPLSADAPPDAAELLLPDDPPLAAAEAGGRIQPRSGAAAAPASEAGRGVALGRYTPARGASRETDAQPNGMTLRLTDMLDLPTERSAKETAPARRRGADAAGESGEKSRVRWSEIADAPPAQGPNAAAHSALDPAHFEEAKKRAPVAAARAAAPELPRPVPTEIQARRRWPWIAGAVLGIAAAAGFFLRRSPISSPVATAEIAPRAAASAEVAAPALPGPSLADSSAAAVAPSDAGSSGAAPSAEEFGRALSSGQALLKKGRYRAAMGELRKAVDIQPESVPALVALGDAFLQSDQARSALGPLQKATQLDRKNGRAQLLLGTAHQTLGHKPEAMKAYRRYLELEPKGEFAGDVRSIVATLGR
jgi:hypothetical protein